MIPDDSTATKTCRKCGIEKPRTEFGKQNAGDGRRATCKECKSAVTRKGKPRKYTVIKGHPYLTLLARLFEKIKVDHAISYNGSPCWLWNASLSKKGYAMFGYGGSKWKGRGHQITYKLFVGAIPDGLQLDHLCRRRSCVNPAHLEPVTSRENSERGNNICVLHARQTHCKRGHEFTPENTYLLPNGTGRQCRACKPLILAEWHRKNPHKQSQYTKKYLAKKHSNPA